MYFTKLRTTDIYERLTYVIQQLKKWKDDYENLYNHFEWKAVLFNVSQSQEDYNIIYSSTFFGVKSGSVEDNDFTWTYDWIDENIFKDNYEHEPRKIHLIKRTSSLSDIIEFLSDIKKIIPTSGNSNNQTTLVFKDYKIRMESIKNIESHFNSTLYTPINWPFYEIKITTDYYRNAFKSPLFSKSSPYFDYYTFPQSFFSIPGIHTSRDTINIALPLYIARIDSVTTSKNALSFNLTNLARKDLSIKLSYTYNYTLGNHKEIIVPKEQEYGEILLDEENYDRMRLVLSVKDSPYYLQTMEMGFLPIKLTKFEKPTSLEELREFTKTGEDQYREFKEDANEKDSFNNILKEMLAFANTNEGIICVGIANDGITYKGIEMQPQKFRDSLIQTVTENCIPPTLKFNVDHIKIHDKFIYLVTVKEGEEKPYFHRIRKFIYYRASGTSRPILRDELIEMQEQKNTTTY